MAPPHSPLVSKPIRNNKYTVDIMLKLSSGFLLDEVALPIIGQGKANYCSLDKEEEEAEAVLVENGAEGR